MPGTVPESLPFSPRVESVCWLRILWGDHSTPPLGAEANPNAQHAAGAQLKANIPEQSGIGQSQNQRACRQRRQDVHPSPQGVTQHEEHRHDRRPQYGRRCTDQ